MNSKRHSLPIGLLTSALLIRERGFKGPAFDAHALAGEENTSRQQNFDSSEGLDSLGDADNHLSSKSAARLSKLADVYRMRGLYSVAEAIVENLLEMRQREVRADDTDFPANVKNLAELYGDNDEYDTTEALYDRALMIMEKVLGLDHLKVAAPVENLCRFT